MSYRTIIQVKRKSMKAIVMNGPGGGEMLEYVERHDPVAGPGEALVEVAFAGVNFMDIGVRQGIAWNETPNPKILGVEGVGRVLAVGDGVECLQPRPARGLGLCARKLRRADRDPSYLAGAGTRQRQR
jgi:D-arabinose 1-dehydrogenase-like Zn-dependent alcohol dehydrogenase